jgi:WD40 repeat protein
MSNRLARIFVGQINHELSAEPFEPFQTTQLQGPQLQGRIQAMAFCNVLPDRPQLAFTSEQGANRELQFVDLTTGQIVRKLSLLSLGEKSNSRVFNIRFSADGTHFASASHDGRRVAIFETTTGRRLYLLPADDGAISWLAWHPNGKQLAVARDDGDISLWNLPAVDKALANVGLDR